MQGKHKRKVMSTCQSHQMMLLTSFGRHSQSSLTGLWVLITIMQEEDYGWHCCSFENKVDMTAWGTVPFSFYCLLCHTHWILMRIFPSISKAWVLITRISFVFSNFVGTTFSLKHANLTTICTVSPREKSKQKPRTTARISLTPPTEDYIDPFRG